MTLMSSLVDSTLSLAVSRRTYVPAVEKVAVVEAALALAKVTVPGPLTTVHAMVRVPGGLGKPSSVTVPTKLAAAGKAMV